MLKSTTSSVLKKTATLSLSVAVSQPQLFVEGRAFSCPPSYCPTNNTNRRSRRILRKKVQASIPQKKEGSSWSWLASWGSSKPTQKATKRQPYKNPTQETVVVDVSSSEGVDEATIQYQSRGQNQGQGLEEGDASSNSPDGDPTQDHVEASSTQTESSDVNDATSNQRVRGAQLNMDPSSVQHAHQGQSAVVEEKVVVEDGEVEDGRGAQVDVREVSSSERVGEELSEQIQGPPHEQGQQIGMQPQQTQLNGVVDVEAVGSLQEGGLLQEGGSLQERGPDPSVDPVHGSGSKNFRASGEQSSLDEEPKFISKKHPLTILSREDWLDANPDHNSKDSSQSEVWKKVKQNRQVKKAVLSDLEEQEKKKQAERIRREKELQQMEAERRQNVSSPSSPVAKEPLMILSEENWLKANPDRDSKDSSQSEVWKKVKQNQADRIMREKEQYMEAERRQEQQSINQQKIVKQNQAVNPSNFWGVALVAFATLATAVVGVYLGIGAQYIGATTGAVTLGTAYGVVIDMEAQTQQTPPNESGSWWNNLW